ncbi:GntR family transcriptional regulator [Pseudonocardia kunmingensis]|uniref:GntR family transcriptional regulator n=2 Tax=Pseudonocardia kunmingensis TaxID=630975 RepID=A0A543DQV7_9PSEU|nr:GntR family transcriptional regulator [Pseudonocardia kunmingensis]
MGGDGAVRTRAAGIVAELAAELEEEIALGLLHPRERLVEDDLMERFGAKRHVVRSALATLESRGAVERRANVGAFVRSYTAKEVRDLYDVRTLLEASCARSIAVPVPPERLDPLVECQQAHDAAVAAQDRRAAHRANLAFHAILFGLSDNRTLVEAVRHHAGMTSSIRSLTVADDQYLLRAQAEHWEMIRALQEGDRDRLVRVCVAHLEPSRDAYLRRLAVG